ncbi:hypothetical protein BC938DRAFT_483971 [Jimgerdemannia flammicorona]|uniref:Cation-transporting P-type ATPase N-terminal domain-containing protein n=1 Tax=Jimgerdemannia flammicorona TaxID=994334 RepID=A0A433QAR7_9FUNG|nr:hypothetical protein BC938DRAFT_483971 [Jimgerdemannia flammicorona]
MLILTNTVQETISPELEALLATDPTKGLTSEEVAQRLAKFGRNELAEVKRSAILKFLSYFTGAIAFLIEAACICAAIVKDWLDFGIILGLLLGQQMAVVTKTGSDTFIGRAANLISITVEQGHFQKIVNQIGNFLIYITIVLNELTFDRPYLSNNYSANDILLYSYLAAEPGANDPIEFAVRTAAEATLESLKTRAEGTHGVPGYKVISFLPFNPSTKMTQATVADQHSGETFKVAKGAPQVIIRLVGGDDDAVRAVNSLARRGLRALGVARTVPGDIERYELVGMISLLDPPRPDSAETIRRCAEYGVEVKMITGDQQVIAREVAQRLGMGRVILDANHLVDPNKSEEEVTEHCVRADGFAQVVPEHKFRVVELLQKKGVLVGMTGDGVNDAPALKKANVGIAVHGCTDAARSAADIVLLAPGLSTIVDGIMTSRAIFQRMRSYALYRITSTVHFLLFFFCITLAFNWELPPVLLILITLLNDAATLVISVDNAKISQKPDKWRLGQLITLSFVLGLLLTAMSFAHFFVARDVFHVSKNQLHTIMYLHISSCPTTLDSDPTPLFSSIRSHFVIFSTRLSGYFWESLPSPTFFVAVMITQVFAMLMSIYGLFGPSQGIEAVGWAWGVSVIGVSLTYFVVLDWVKVQIFRRWSFELTVKLAPMPKRVAKLEARKAEQIRKERIMGNWGRARSVMVMTGAVVGFKRAVERKQEGERPGASA